MQKKLVAYLSDKMSQKIELIEISLSDIELKESEQLYLFRFGDELCKSDIYERKPGQFFFFAQKGTVPIEKAEQIWKVVKKKPEN